MKEVLRAAGVPVRPAPARAAAPAEALAFADEVGFPLVAKPPAGAGAQATFRLDDADALRGWLRGRAAERRTRPALLEEFLAGEEHTFDSVTVGGHDRVVVDRRLPPAAAGGAAQPVDPVDGAAAPRHRRPASTPASTMAGRRRCGRSGVTRRAHPHGVVPPPGRLGRRLGGRRPGRPGAQLTSMHGYAHDFDLYRAWAELVILDRFDAAGAAVRGRDGVPARHGARAGARGARRRGLQQQIGHLVVEARLPQPGQPAASDYMGEGYVIVRDPDTAVVRGRAAPDRQRRPRRAGGGLTGAG